MANDRMEAEIATFIAGHVSARSGLPNTKNWTSSQILDLQRAANSLITNSFSGKSETNFDIDSISRCFQCLYMIPSTDEVSVLKKNQLFVIKLIERKQYKMAWIELHRLSHILNRVVNSVETGENSPIGNIPLTVDILDGIPYVECIVNETLVNLIIGIIVAHHFLCLQNVLLYLSSNVKGVSAGVDPLLKLSMFENVNSFFQSNSNFMHWIVLSSQLAPENIAKYTKNAIKMLNGYIKIIEILARNLKVPILKECRMNLNSTLNELASGLVLGGTRPRKRQRLEPNSVITVQEITSTAHEVHECLLSLAESPSSILLDQLNIRLMEASHDLLNHDTIVKAMAAYNLQNDSFSRTYVKIILSAFATRSGHLKSLGKLHLELIDSFTIFVKDLLPRSEDSAILTSIISQLYTILNPFNHYKRLRNLSNLLYLVGNKWQNVEAWKWSIKYELNITLNESDYISFNTKALKVCNMLLVLGYNDESSRLLLSVLEKNQNLQAQLSLSGSLLLQVVYKCISQDDKFPRLVFGNNSLSDDFKLALVFDIFRVLEKSEDVSNKSDSANKIVQEVTFQNDDYKLISVYYYYNVNGLSLYLDIKIPTTKNSLLNCGLILQKLINIEFSESQLVNCIHLFEIWLMTPTKVINTYEQNIIITFLHYLKYNGCTGHLIRIISTFKIKSVSLDPQLKLLLESELCLAISQLSLYNDVSNSLIDLKSNLKANNATSLTQILSFNILQLEYCIGTGHIKAAKEKFEKILSILSAREEFQLNSNARLSAVDKFNNLLLVAKFQAASAKLNIALNQPVASYNNLRMAIKLLYSIVIKCGPNMPKELYYQIKWETSNLLLDSYKRIIVVLKRIGITRDSLFYQNELKKINEQTLAPLINCINYFEILLFNIFMDRHEDREILLSKLDDLLGQRIVSTNLSVKFFKNIANGILKLNGKSITLPHFSTLDEIPYSELVSMYRLDYTQEKTFEYLTSLYTKESPVVFDVDDLIPSKILQIKKQVDELFFKMKSHPQFKFLLQVPQCLPSVHEGGKNMQFADSTILNDFLAIKERIMECIAREDFVGLAIYELKDISFVLFRCLHIISSITIYLPKSSLLEDCYYLQDLVKALPVNNDRLLNRDSKSSNQLLPEPISHSIESFDSKSLEFATELSMQLPLSWSVITLDICPYSGDILLSRYIKGKHPWFLRLPISRYHDRSPRTSVISFQEMETQFKEIIRQSDLSTKSSTTSKIHTKEERKNWWRLRFSLDLKMKDLLDHISDYWFGGFKGLFFNYDEDAVFQKFKTDFLKIINNLLPSRVSETGPFSQLDDNIILLFYSLPSYDVEAVDDLIIFLVDTLNFHGEHNDFSSIRMDQLHNSLEVLFDKYFSLRSPCSREHIVIVPSSNCTFFPWESLGFLSDKSISRVTSVRLLLGLLKNGELHASRNSGNAYYLVNPGGDLKRTEERFQPIFESKKGWKGSVGKQPEEEELLSGIINSDLFVYLGHGGCEQYLRASTLFRKCLPNGPFLPPTLLIGCSSGALQMNGILEPYGNIFNWLACGTPSVLVNLWDVTDKDIDQFSESVFEKWGLLHTYSNSLNLAEAVSKSRSTCTLKYLNGSAPVVYGLPLRI